MIEHDFTAAHTLGWVVLIRGLAVTPLDFLLVLIRLIGRNLSLRGDADAALLGAAEVVALQGVLLIRLAILLTELIGRKALTIGRITVVFLHRRAHQVRAEGLAGLVVDDLLTGTLSLTGKVTKTPLRLLTVWSLSLRWRAVASLVLTPMVFATRGIVLIGLAQKVSERVLRRHGSWQRQALGEPEGRDVVSAYLDHPYITSFRPFVDSRASGSDARSPDLQDLAWKT